MDENKYVVLTATHNGVSYNVVTKNRERVFDTFKKLLDKGIDVSISNVELEDFTDIILLENEL